MDGTHKSSALLGEAFLDVICTAVREEIRSALKEGGFCIDDRLIDVEEAAQILCVPKTWLFAHSRQLPFTRRVGPKALRFSYRGIQKWIELKNR